MITAQPLGIGRNLLSGGFRASNNFQGDSTYALLGRFSRRPFNSRGAELRVSGQVGTDLGLTIEYYEPFGRESRFFALSAIAYRAERLLLDFRGIRLGEFWQQTTEARLRVGRELGDWGILALDGILSTVKAETQVAIVPLAASTDRFSGLGLLFGVDTLDQVAWPSRGFQLRASMQRLEQLSGDGGNSDRYQVRAVKPLRFDSIGVILRLIAEETKNDENNPIDLIRLGGFRPLSAVGENSVLSNRFTLGSVEVFKRLNPSRVIVSVPMYAGLLLEYADVDFDLIDVLPQANQYVSVGAYLGVDTVLGGSTWVSRRARTIITACSSTSDDPSDDPAGRRKHGRVRLCNPRPGRALRRRAADARRPAVDR